MRFFVSNEKFFILLSSVLLILFGMSVMLAWYLPMFSGWVQLEGIYVPVDFSSALCYTLCGIGFLSALNDKYKIQEIIGLLLIVIAGYNLFNHIFNFKSNFDHLFVNTERVRSLGILTDKMSFNAEIAFIIMGFIFNLLLLKQHKLTYILIQFLIFIVFFVGLFGFLSYIFRLDYMLSWFNYTRIALRSSIGFLIVSILAWMITKKSYRDTALQDYGAKRISLMTGMILISITLLSSLANFAVFFHQNQNQLEHLLENELDDQLGFLHKEVERGVVKFTAITENLNLDILSKNNDAAYVAKLSSLFIDQGFSDVVIINTNKKVILDVGNLKISYAMAKLKTQPAMRLVWNDAFYIEFVSNLTNHGVTVGSIKAVYPLYALTHLFTSDRNNDEEFVLCQRAVGLNSNCITSKSFPKMINIPLIVNNHVLPMESALRGEKGLMTALDYQERYVIAAYSPMKYFGDGVGMVFKIDYLELMTPFLKKLSYIVPLILIVTFIGIMFLYYQVLPLIHRIVESEKLAKKLKNQAELDEKYIRTVIDNIGEGLVTINEDSIIQTVNHKTVDIFGYQIHELINAPLTILMPPALRQKHLEGIKHFIETNEAHVIGKGAVELQGLHKNGTIFPLELSVTEFYIGKQKLFTGIVRDISERKKVDKMKNEFISMVSHELRTPLTSIQGSLSLLISGVVGGIPEPAKQFLTIANQNSERLIRLINDILDIEKIEAGKTEFKIYPLEINELVQEAVLTNESYGKKFSVDLVLHPCEKKFIVHGDHDRLLQVMTNLISNAIKFSPAGGSVILELIEKEGFVKICVHDKGSGIPKEFQKRIFQKFAQADSSSTRSHAGTGLGLSISKAIVDKLGGRIGYTTEENKGTTFYFELPIVEIKQPYKRYYYKSKSSPSILYIENDSDLIQTVLTSIRLEANLDGVTNLKDAKAAIEKRNYDLVVLDLKLADGSGIEILPLLKQRNIQTIVFSAFELPVEYHSYVEQKLIKSKTSIDQLLKVIEDILNSKTKKG